MELYDAECPVCGRLNRRLYLEETEGWMECEHCGTLIRCIDYPDKLYKCDFKTGDKAFMLENNKTVQQVTITDCFGGLYTVKFSEGGVSRVKWHRLFSSPEEAEKSRYKRQLPAFRQSGTTYT